MIKKIHHVSDIHIRLLKRHKEYKIVFENLYSKIRENKEDSIIVVSGDILHSKTEMSPELVSLTAEFFKKLSSICKTIITLGNHDCNLNNLSRLDAISPIIQTINSDNIIFLKDSKLFEIDNLVFSNMSILDNKEDYIFSKDIFSDKTKIALFHGIVGGALVEEFFKNLVDINVEEFDGFDMVLLGDIHEPQRLQEYNKALNKPEVWYPGSLVQNNYGEKLTHGYLLWDVESRKAEFIRIENEYGYHTIEVNNGNYEIPSDFSNNPRIRLKVINTSTSDIQRISADLRKIFNVQEIITNHVDREVNTTSSSKKTNLIDVRNVSVQNTLIRDFIKTKFIDVKDDVIGKVCTINEDINKELSQNETIRNIVWVPKRFEFSNMFSYGDNNVIDFTRLQGIIGLFAPNATGKSSLIDALIFCIFDKSPRAFKALNILNNKKSSFYCKFNFEIDGLDFWIERRAYKLRTGNVKVDVSFWTYGDDGNEISLNGEDRDQTNQNIRGYIGTYEDFVTTAVSVQGNADSFVDKSQTERKNFLAKFLDIGIFDELYEIASEKSKEINTLLNQFKKQDLSTKLSGFETDYDKNEILRDKLISDKDVLEKKESEINEEILKNFQKKISVNANLIDVDELIEQKNENTQKIDTIEKELGEVSNITFQHKSTAVGLYKKVKNLEDGGIIQRYGKYDRLSKEYRTINFKFEKEKIKIEQKKAVLKDLESHEYDPNCPFCVNNVFVKKAIQTKKELVDEEIKFEQLKNEVLKLKSQIDEQVKIEYDYFIELKNELENEKMLAFKFDSKKTLLERDRDEMVSANEKIDDSIKQYNENKIALEHNKQLDEIIRDLKSNLSGVTVGKRGIEKKLQVVLSKMEVLKSDIEKIYELMETAKEMELNFEAHKLYIESISRDGIPYELISNTIPQLQEEVNDILAQLVDFNIVFNLDGKHINAYIAYDDTKFWPIEMVSGMEKFISSLAIRCALLNISNLSRPTFLTIDEGFGVLDSDNISSIGYLFDYLKQKFDFVLIVSHIDTMKDMVDFALDITKNLEGFSYISHT